jgi:quercetin dioxygenase-like cupin family protein
MTDTLSWSPQTIDWQEIGADGTKYALLRGERDVPGVSFSYAFHIPKGFWDPPHWHTADAHVFVAKGTLYLAYGETLDRSKLVAYPEGSYVVVPANARHFDGSDEDCLIFGTAIGPWATHYVDAAHTPSAGTPKVA